MRKKALWQLVALLVLTSASGCMLGNEAKSGESGISPGSGISPVSPAPDDHLATCQLYGIERDAHRSRLFTVDLRVGQAHDLGEARDHLDLAALAIHPDTRIIYAVSRGNGSESARLYTVHGKTGELDIVADTGLTQVEGLAFHPVTHTLWASTSRGLATLDLATGNAMPVPACAERPAGGLAWNPEGTILYIGQGNHLWAYEPAAEEPCRARVDLPQVTKAFEMRPDGRILAVGQGRGDDRGPGDRGPDGKGPGDKGPDGKGPGDQGTSGNKEPSGLFVYDLADERTAATYELPGEYAHIEDLAWLGACGVPTPGGTADLIQNVSVDKQQVCVGEIVTVTVTAQHPEAEGSAVEVSVNGKMGSPQYLQFTGEPGARVIHVLATTADHYLDSAEITVEVVACEERFPIVYVRPNPYRHLTVDFQVANADELGAVAAYVWDFGDGQTATTSEPYASHFYGDAMSTDELYTVFQAELTVDRTAAADLTARKTVPIWSLYAFNKKRGVIQPPVESSGRLEQNGGTLRATVSIKNPENAAIELRSRFLEYQYCNPDLNPTAQAAEAVDIRIEAGAQLDHTVEVPSSIATSGVCGIAVNLTGDAPGGRSAVVTAYLEVQDNPLMRGPVLDPARRSLLNQVAAAGLVADPNRITDEELYQLAMAGKLEFPLVNNSVAAFADPPIGEQCQPGEAPPHPGVTCQATNDWELVQPHIANALKGHTVLSSGCGMIGKLMLHVTPPQKFSHSGLMTRNFFELRHSTAADERFQDYPDGVFDEPTDGFREDVLKFGWPGTITQSIDAAYNGQLMQDPEPGSNRWYRIDAFTPEPRLCEDDVDLVFPIVIKPPPGAGAIPGVQQKLDDTVDQMSSLFGHYRFFIYSNAAISLDPDLAAPEDAGWAEGSLPTVCSSSIWLSMKQAGIDLEGTLEPSDFSLGAMVDGETEDGLYLYTEGERKAAAQFLYNFIYDEAYAQTGWLGRVFTDAPDDIASQIVNCFGSDDCGQHAKDSDAWEEPGVGRAVSPDDMLFWDAPPFGIYGHNEPLVYRTGRFMRVHRWAASAGTGTIQGTVRDHNGNPVQDAFVFVPSLGGVEDSTGAGGAFELIAVPGGTYEVKAQKLIDGLLFEASALATVLAGQVVTVNLALAPPPQNNRRVRVIGSMHIVDDEIFDDEIGDFPILREVDLNPVQTQQQITISQCVGDEVRVELRISLRLLADNVSVETIVQTSLFEGTACDTDDLEDSDSRSVVVAEDSGQSVSIHLESDGVGGGDTADIDLNIVNQRQN